MKHEYGKVDMFRILVAIVGIAAAGAHYSDLSSPSAFKSVFLPLCAVLAFVALALWFVVLFHRKGMSQTSSTRGGISSDSFGMGNIDGGGDGGH